MLFRSAFIKANIDLMEKTAPAKPPSIPPPERFTIPSLTITPLRSLYDGESTIFPPPETVIDGYRFGAKENENLNVLISVGGSVTQYTSRIVMQNSQDTSEKIAYVNRSPGGINSITSNTAILTLT